jgi:hypothetical protein
MTAADVAAFELRVRRALALRMGYPLRVLGRLMTYAEFLDWCRHFAEHPFDDHGLVEIPIAKLQAAIHNAAVNDKKYLLNPADFLPKPSGGKGADLDSLVLTSL